MIIAVPGHYICSDDIQTMARTLSVVLSHHPIGGVAPFHPNHWCHTIWTFFKILIAFLVFKISSWFVFWIILLKTSSHRLKWAVWLPNIIALCGLDVQISRFDTCTLHCVMLDCKSTKNMNISRLFHFVQHFRKICRVEDLFKLMSTVSTRDKFRKWMALNSSMNVMIRLSAQNPIEHSNFQSSKFHQRHSHE